MSSIRPSLSETLRYPEQSRRLLMAGFADAVDRVAANNRRADIELWQVCKALGEPNVPTLLALRDYGFPAYKSGMLWRIDSRGFRRWATSYTPYGHARRAANASYKEEGLF